MMPNKWGQGQLFAFSALDGDSFFAGDFAGTLSGDKIGQAKQIKEKTLSVINEWHNRTGTIFEFYDSENRTPPYCFNRKGEVVEPYDFRIKYQSIKDYGRSVTLAFDMLSE